MLERSTKNDVRQGSTSEHGALNHITIATFQTNFSSFLLHHLKSDRKTVTCCPNLMPGEHSLQGPASATRLFVCTVALTKRKTHL